MQRRAAAIYAAFFIVIAAGSYAVIGVAQPPTVTVDDPTYSLSEGDTVDADGRTYTVGQIQPGTNEGNDLRSTELAWTNQSAQYTATLENNSTVPSDMVQWQGQTTQGEPYRVLVGQGADPSAFTFNQEFNVSARLASDPAVEDQPITRADGQQYVVYRENGTTRPLSAYLPEPERRQFSEGDPLQYNGTGTQVADVSNESVTLTWTAPRDNSIPLEEGATMTLDGTEYVAHFPDNSTLVLSSDLEAYNQKVEAVNTYHERTSGFWGITIISGLAAVFLLMIAYLPSRY